MIEATLPELLSVVKKLRSEEGCPWDKVQTHQSLIPYLEEESAEVIDAIHTRNTDEMKEELADLLFQVLLHSQIAEESGEFNFYDVMTLLQEKIIRRHPHVFAGKVYASIAEQKEDWQRIKAKEREAKGISEARSLLAGIPQALPALKQAGLLQEKAATVGFDWDDIADVWGKVEEEKAELLEAVEVGHPSEIESELGDLLFSLVNYSRFLHVDATKALNSTNQKFRRRFQYIEDHAKKDLSSLSLEELDQYWNDAKKAGK